jgi:hypothetical protein
MKKNANLHSGNPSKQIADLLAAMRSALTPGLRASALVSDFLFDSAVDLKMVVRKVADEPQRHFALTSKDIVVGDPEAIRALTVARAISTIDPALYPPTEWPCKLLPERNFSQLKAEGPTPYPATIVAALERGQDVLLYGRSASGKTIAARNAQRTLMHLGVSTYWLDFSVPDANLWDFIATLAQLPTSQRVVLFVDDPQALPAEAERIQRLREISSTFPELSFQLVLIVWESARRVFLEGWPAIQPVHVVPDKAMHAVLLPLSGVDESGRDQLQMLVGGDLVAAVTAVRFFERERRFATSDELALEELDALCGSSPLTDNAANVLLHASALSQFEIDVAEGYLLALSPVGFAELKSLRVLRRAGAYFSVGHRSTARLVHKALLLRRPSLAQDVGEPARLALEYLQSTTPAQLVNTLDRLDIAALKKSGSEQQGTRFLGSLWSSLQTLLRLLDRSALQDPTWRDDTGSACFAARTLSDFGKDSANSTVQHVRDRWNLPSDFAPPEPAVPLPNERKDFIEIELRMVAEDGINPILGVERASEIDFDRMHRTWAIGLLLALETASSTSNSARLQRLKRMAANIPLPNGAFYPQRVPWSTARVLIGLSQAGETYQSSQTVADACNWLLRSRPDGPFDYGAWEPNTGGWNSIVGTSAMCVNALVRCGVPSSHEEMGLALNYLMQSRGEWGRLGGEIDAVFAIEAFLLAGYVWRDFIPELRRLIEWTENPKLWDEVVLDASESQDESLKVPLISTVLLSIIWGIVRAELPLLLEDLAFGTLLPATATPIVDRREVNLLLSRLDEIDQHVRSNINDRLKRLAGSLSVRPNMIAKLGVYRDAAKRVDAVRRQLIDAGAELRAKESGEAISAAKLELNALGVEFLGEVWEDL